MEHKKPKGKTMQYEVLERDGKYRWELYSRYGYPLRNILASGVCDTKEEAEHEAEQKMRAIKDEMVNKK